MQLPTNVSGNIKQVRQLSSIGRSGIQGANNLCFIYPVLSDTQLRTEQYKMLRNFFVVDVMSSIKSNNILNIISDISFKQNEIPVKLPNLRNPADDLRNTYQLNNSEQVAGQPILQQPHVKDKYQ